MRHAFLSFLLLLIACGTPRENCVAAVSRNIRALDALIATSKANHGRGYAIRQETYWYTLSQRCGHMKNSKGGGKPVFCDVERHGSRDVNVSINPDREARRLRSMVAKRQKMFNEALPFYVECTRLYPKE